MLDYLVNRIRGLEAERERVIVGIAGEPGSGKSTLVVCLVGELGGRAAAVGLDGFHLANELLLQRGLASEKGSVRTFDLRAYGDLIERLSLRGRQAEFTPAYKREVEEVVPRAAAIPRSMPVILTEGNYLLLDEPHLARARAHMSEVWYLDADPGLRRERLIARHVMYGKSPAAARQWVAAVDEPNAELIRSQRHLANLTIRLQ